jgi:hypothetical protein
LKRVWEVLSPYPEVVEGRVTEDSFVVSVGGIWERLELGRSIEVDPRYLNPEGFYRRTHFTDAMKEVLRNVVRRLNGESVQSTYHLRVGMGGGKSHTLLLLYYLVRQGEKVSAFLKAEGIAQVPPKARVAVLDGMRIQPLFGVRYPDGSRVNTPWGLLLKQLGVYDAYKALDAWQEIPSVPVLREALSTEPTLILVDEITFFMDMVRVDEIQSNRVQQFLQALTAAVSETKGCVLVITTPIGVYEEAARLLAKVLDRYSRPMILATGGEYKQIRKRALFQDDFRSLRGEIASLAQEYRNYYSTHLPAYASQAEEMISENYPFNPFVDRTLLKLKNNRAFQEVRDELRFLAGLVYSVYKAHPPDAYLISVGHAELADQYVRAGTIAKLQNPILVNRLDNDLARIKSTLEPGLHEAATRLLATIALNSLAAETHLQLGITEDEVVYALLTPDLSPALLRKALTECGKNLWFVNLTDGRWVFGSPNLNKLVDDYLRKVERDKSLRGLWWSSITEELNGWKTSAYKAYLKESKERKTKPFFEEQNVHVWPGRSEEIPDDRSMKLVLLDYHLPLTSVIPAEFLSDEEKAATIITRVASSREEAAKAAKEFYENWGKQSRTYKNTVFFLVAERGLVEKDGPIKYAKQLLALDGMLKDRAQLQPLIGETGVKSIEQMKEISTRDLIPNCVTAYRYLLYPSRDGLAAIELGEERRNLTGFLSMVEAKLRDQAQKVVEKVGVDSLLTRYWPQGKPRPEVKDVVEGFYRRPELELVLEPAAVEDSIRTALREGKLVYTYGLDLYYRREPLRLEENGVLLKDFEVIPITFEAVDEQNKPLGITFTLDERSSHRTPFTLEDLKDNVHTILAEIPTDMAFLGWSDGVQDMKRNVIWDAKRTLRLLLKPKAPPPPPIEVTLTLEAVDVSRNQPLAVNIWLDDLQYRTPYQGKVAKDTVHEVRLERPAGLMFLGWNDLVESPERKLTCDINTTLVAKLKPIVGIEIWEASAKLGEACEQLKAILDREAKALRLEVSADYSVFSKFSGSIGMLLKERYQATFTGSGGVKLGLNLFNISVGGDSDKLGVMKSSLTQLKDYLESVTVTLSFESADYRPVREVLSADALTALKSAEGALKCRAQLLATGVKEVRPKRTLEGVIEAFKKEV